MGWSFFSKATCVFLALCGAANVSRAAVQIVDTRVSSGADDAEESSVGVVSLGSSDLELVNEATNQTVGVRFRGLNVPPGARILSAWLQFEVDETSTETTLVS